MSPSVKSVAVIGVGPAGAITIDALAQEQAFSTIRVFERREKPGGCWIPDPPEWEQQIPDFDKIAKRTVDEPLDVPTELPVWTPRSRQYRFSDTSMYPKLETNIVAKAMEFTQEPFPDQKSAWSTKYHGSDTPFRHNTVVQQYIEDLVNRNGYLDLVEFNTTVEKTEKKPGSSKWTLYLRKEVAEKDQDYWWSEEFDAVVVASGHYTVPYIPYIEGLAEFAKRYPGSVEHTKAWRGADKYRHKRVVTVGSSISGPDTAAALAGITKFPLHCAVTGRYHPYFGDWAFKSPHIVRHAPISHVDPETRTVFFQDDTSVSDVENIILGTGYTWTLHFLDGVVEIRNNRAWGLFQHVFWLKDPTLTFAGAIQAGFTFKAYEYQAVLLSRYLAGRISLPPLAEMQKWETDRIAYKGTDGPKFAALYPDFEEYFEEVRELAGEPQEIEVEEIDKQTGDKKKVKTTVGRKLIPFDKQWREEFNQGHVKRIEMWKRLNREAEEKLRVANGHGDVAVRVNGGALVGELVGHVDETTKQ